MPETPSLHDSNRYILAHSATQNRGTTCTADPHTSACWLQLALCPVGHGPATQTGMEQPRAPAAAGNLLQHDSRDMFDRFSYVLAAFVAAVPASHTVPDSTDRDALRVLLHGVMGVAVWHTPPLPDSLCTPGAQSHFDGPLLDHAARVVVEQLYCHNTWAAHSAG